MLAERMNGYPPLEEMTTFLARPTTQLNSWTLSDIVASIAHYGAAYLFLSYLYDHYGRRIIRELVADRAYTDFQLVDNVLKRLHISTTADRLFADWAVANFVNDRSIYGGRYGYGSENTHHAEGTVANIPYQSSDSVPPYAAEYDVFDNLQNQKPFRVQFSGAPTVPLVSAGHAAPSWWSNRGHTSDTRLDRSFELRHASNPVPHYHIRYDPATQSDYGHAELSSEGGPPWRPHNT